MITVTAAETRADNEDLRRAFAASQTYLDAVYAKTNEDAGRQSLAGLRALLFLLRERGVDPAPLILSRGKSGKPYFANCPLQFGISHSGDLAVCALSDLPVGIDVERLREKKNAEIFAKRFFSPRECAILTAARDKNNAFFEIWTKKEAALKLRGRGIDSPLAEIDTTQSAFSVFDIKAAGGDYVASVAGDDSVRIIGGLVWTKRK